jgi:hypothetical protein
MRPPAGASLLDFPPTGWYDVGRGREEGQMRIDKHRLGFTILFIAAGNAFYRGHWVAGAALAALLFLTNYDLFRPFLVKAFNAATQGRFRC